MATAPLLGLLVSDAAGATFDGFPIVGLTAPTLLGITVYLLLTGRIVPRSTLRDKAQESENWRLAFEAERTARIASDAQTAQLLETAKTSQAVMTAIFEVVRAQSGGDHAHPPEE